MVVSGLTKHPATLGVLVPRPRTDDSTSLPLRGTPARPHQRPLGRSADNECEVGHVGDHDGSGRHQGSRPDRRLRDAELPSADRGPFTEGHAVHASVVAAIQVPLLGSPVQSLWAGQSDWTSLSRRLGLAAVDAGGVA